MPNLDLIIRHGVVRLPTGQNHWFQAVVTSPDDGPAFQGGHCIEIRAYRRLSSKGTINSASFWGGPDDPHHIGKANTAFHLKPADGYVFAAASTYTRLDVAGVVALVADHMGDAAADSAIKALSFLTSEPPEQIAATPSQAVDLALAALPAELSLSVI